MKFSTMMRVDDPRSEIEALRAATDELYSLGYMPEHEYITLTGRINAMTPSLETKLMCQAITDRINVILDDNGLPYYFGLHPHPATIVGNDWIGFFGSETFFPAEDER